MPKWPNLWKRCAYYLLTFTLPAELRPLAHRQQKVLYGLLLQCAVASLQKLCRDPQWLGAQPSVLSVLHTWTRALAYHPHAHLLVSAGGLSVDGQHWLEPKNAKFLVPVRALSTIFGAKMHDALKARGLLASVPPCWPSKKWVVHARRPVAERKYWNTCSASPRASPRWRAKSSAGLQPTFKPRDWSAFPWQSTC